MSDGVLSVCAEICLVCFILIEEDKFIVLLPPGNLLSQLEYHTLKPVVTENVIVWYTAVETISKN